MDEQRITFEWRDLTRTERAQAWLDGVWLAFRDLIDALLTKPPTGTSVPRMLNPGDPDYDKAAYALGYMEHPARFDFPA